MQIMTQYPFLTPCSSSIDSLVYELIFFFFKEVEYSEEPGALYHIKYRVAGGSKYLIF